ncbi:MAG: helix-turn-helix transcriptional regulator [Thermoflexaceae bacterium]|nr:helix-turn-helix transcriptional regulator [Thermoflexaceae bacterium]
MSFRRTGYNADAGRRLQTARRNLGITQAEMAEELDICEETFSKLERGISGLTAERLNHLYKSYNISPDYIVTGVEKKDINVEIEEYLLSCNKEEQVRRAYEIMEDVMKLLAGVTKES